jgi:three-Cys-motif partner protein
MAKKTLQRDEIGVWSEVKLEIIKKYAAAYSTILSRQRAIRGHVYIDAFAGAGTHISKETGESISGSPVNALQITPPFTELHFVDLDGNRAEELRRLAAGDKRVTVHNEDCNDVLLRDLFPQCQWSTYKRALCLLDPYGLNVNWKVLAEAGRMKTVEIFYNFMIMDANMNVLMRDPSQVSPEQAARMDAAWGDRSWQDAAYRKEEDLFGTVQEKASNEDIAEAFRKRLRDVAGFKYVPEPMPMRNTKGAVIYYLYFASAKAVAAHIVEDIFARYRNRGAA